MTDPTSRPGVLVTDGHQRKSVAAVRALGRSGFPVAVVERSAINAASCSRYVSARWSARKEDGGDRAWVQSVGRRCLASGVEVILPMEDSTISRIARYGTELPSNIHSCFPADAELFSRLSDKAFGIRSARRLGWRHPTSWIPADGEQPEGDGPFIVKPRWGGGSRGVRRLKDRRELDVYLASMDTSAVVIQEMMAEGPLGIGASVVLRRDGSLAAACAHQRLREFPVTGGPSTYRETIDAPELIERAHRFFADHDWWGPGMLEFRQDPDGGDPWFVEVNPRFWGSLHLAVRAGCNVPAISVDVAQRRMSETILARPGVRARWYWPGDLLHRWTRGSVEGFYWIPGGQQQCDIFQLSDPGPIVGTVVSGLAMLSDAGSRNIILRNP